MLATPSCPLPASQRSSSRHRMRRSLIRLLPYQHHKHIRLFGTQRTSDPLRILFCGSDDFSISSLQRLHKEHTQREDVIASIDVVCRPAKRVGRGLKAIRTGIIPSLCPPPVAVEHTYTRLFANILSVPIAKVAEELSLPLHEVDTFTGWKVNLSESILGDLLMTDSLQNLQEKTST